MLVLGAPSLFGGVCLAIGAFFQISTTGPQDGRGELQFTPEVWRSSERDPDGARYLMVDDLLAAQVLVGRTRAEVEALLGPMKAPTDYPWGGWCYFLGPEPSVISLDYCWLGLRFDASDQVAATSIFTY